uniref:Secreted protein n=1 Tax=Oryza brachyantha TaxID=4533 RepID=J3KXE3_ORYBR
SCPAAAAAAALSLSLCSLQHWRVWFRIRIATGGGENSGSNRKVEFFGGNCGFFLPSPHGVRNHHTSAHIGRWWW